MTIFSFYFVITKPSQIHYQSQPLTWALLCLFAVAEFIVNLDIFGMKLQTKKNVHDHCVRKATNFNLT